MTTASATHSFYLEKQDPLSLFTSFVLTPSPPSLSPPSILAQPSLPQSSKPAARTWRYAARMTRADVILTQFHYTQPSAPNFSVHVQGADQSDIELPYFSANGKVHGVTTVATFSWPPTATKDASISLIFTINIIYDCYFIFKYCYYSRYHHFYCYRNRFFPSG